MRCLSSPMHCMSFFDTWFFGTHFGDVRNHPLQLAQRRILLSVYRNTFVSSIFLQIMVNSSMSSLFPLPGRHWDKYLRPGTMPCRPWRSRLLMYDGLERPALDDPALARQLWHTAEPRTRGVKKGRRRGVQTSMFFNGRMTHHAPFFIAFPPPTLPHMLNKIHNNCFVRTA